MRRLIAIAVALFALFEPAPASSQARDDRYETSTETSSEGGSEPFVAAGVDVRIGDDGGPVNLGPDPYAGCDVFGNLSVLDLSVLSSDVGVPPALVDGEEPVVDPTVYVLIRCNAGFIRWWEQGDPVPADVVDLLVRSARSRVAIVPPTPSMSPDGSSFPFITQLPVWFWVDDSAWVPAQASASIPELGLTVTVAATPASVVWNPGDGSASISCAQGTPWSASLPVDAQSNCQHVYTDALSADEVSLVVTNQVSYGLTVSCAPAAICANVPALPGLTVTASRDVRVAEIRGVITS